MLKQATVNDNPREISKALVGGNLCRYHASDYRILVKIYDDKLIVETLLVAHRSEVYKNLQNL